MLRVIIIYGPEDQSTINSANKIKTAFETEGCEAVVKTVKNTIIPDIAASEIIIIGSHTKEKKSVHPDFKEITRALQGINLAGKVAGIFTIANKNTITCFREILDNSDITLCEEDLIIEDENDNPNGETDWVKKIITLYKEGS